MLKTKKLILSIISIGFLITAKAQTGAFTETVQFQSQSRSIHYYVDPSYDANNEYQLFVGMSGCGESPELLRNNLTFLATQKNAIIICPASTIVAGGFLGDQESAFVSEAIQIALNNYSINENEVYLHGFSCNGYTTLQMGLNEVYPFKGIIPLHPGINSMDLNGAVLPFDKNVPTCICSGTIDFGHSEAQILRDSLQNRNQPVLWNPIPGVAHEHYFPTFETEILECFTFFESLGGSSSISEINDKNDASIYPNPFSNELYIKSDDLITSYRIFDLMGNIIQNERFNSNPIMKIDLNENLSKGSYLIELVYEEKSSYHSIIKE